MTSPSISSPRRWEHFEHMADMGVRGVGPSRESAFEEAALAMCAAITDPELVRPDKMFEVDCSARENELLLVDWLNALIAEMSAHRLIFSKFEVSIAGGHLHGRAWGEIADPARHHPAVEVKGATLTELKVTKGADGLWIAQCVVDV
ncbi:MAG TPA: archease [Candidatus Limnocylindrales bacterium]|nr:archease [Candidatus Limnocylindrales bacterium]